MATQDKITATARKSSPAAGHDEQQSHDGGGNGEAEEHSRLGQALGRAGTAVGDSLTGLTRRGNGDGEGNGQGAGGAPKAAAAAALSAVATIAGSRLLERPRRRVMGIPVPGTRRSRTSIAKELARRLPGM